MNNNYVIIMAGGIGSRFWPMSQVDFPKQFHDVLGTGKTLIQQTVKRFKTICPNENIYVLTNTRYAGLVKEQVPEIPEENILLEPVMRNTAPCIAYATFKIGQKNPEAKMIVSPADHLVEDVQRFVSDINLAIERTSETDNLVTLGIKPHRPDTGYGYIHFDNSSSEGKVRKVNAFTEKPPYDKAVKFLKSGDYYWNSGIFIWSYKNILRELNASLPDVSRVFEEGMGFYNTPKEQSFIDENYGKCQNISIDYGVMEKSHHVEMIMTDFGWSDLGTWGSLYEHLNHDQNKNAIVGKNVSVFDSTNNIIRNSTDKMMIIRGLDDFIVVDTKQALLICPKAEEQEIKQMVAKSKE